MGTNHSDTQGPLWKELHVQLLVALIAGVLAGGFLGEHITWIGVLGDIFVSFLKMVVMPLIFCSILVAIAGLGGSKLGVLGGRTILYYLLTTALAVMIGILVANTVRPGDGASIQRTSAVVAYEIDFDEDGTVDARQEVGTQGDRKLEVPNVISRQGKATITYWVIYADGSKTEQSIQLDGPQESAVGGLDVTYDSAKDVAYLEPTLPKQPKVDIKVDGAIDTLLKAIPSNPIGSIAAGEVLPTVIFAILLALALLKLGARAQPVIDVCAVISDAMIVIVDVLLKFTPIGVFALMAATIADSGFGVLQNLLKYCGAVILGLGLQILIVYPTLLMVVAKISPLTFFSGMKEAILLAFSTSSSSATLPVTMGCLENNLGVQKRVTNFVLPLGATVNMDGTALYEAMAAMFIAQAYGIDLSLAQQVTIFVTANLAAVGAAGIPGAGLITMALVLNAVGLPLEGLGMILAVDRILDMFRTATNVAGDGAVTLIVASSANDAPQGEPLESSA